MKYDLYINLLFCSLSSFEPYCSFSVSTSNPPPAFLICCVADSAQPVITFSIRNRLTLLKSHSFLFITRYFGTAATLANGTRNISAYTKERVLLLFAFQGGLLFWMSFSKTSINPRNILNNCYVVSMSTVAESRVPQLRLNTTGCVSSTLP